MKNILFFAAALALLFIGCSAPARQIVTIQAEDTPLPAVTPLLTSAPSEAPISESSPSSSAAPAKTPIPTVSPTAVPTAQLAAEPTPEPTPVPTAEPSEDIDSSDFGSSVLALVNSYRNSAGLSPLKYSSSMQKAADTRAKECVISFSHTRPDGSNSYTSLTEAGLSFTAFGENLFASTGIQDVSAEFVVEQWMASLGHKENILRDGFTHMCIGVASQGDNVYVVQLFGAGIS